jgi:CO/xanthine dehydrogenase Mo-binding subunit
MAAAPAFSVIGKPVPRVEGRDKVSGGTHYATDVVLPGMLWGKNVRSPHAHARILSIETSRAKAVPGVRAVLTAADLPSKLVGRFMGDYEVLASEVVRFIGEPVATIAADTTDTAEEAAALVQVEYEELPSVFDPHEALQPGSVLLHPELRSYRGFPEDIPENLRNVFSRLVVERGDLDAGFAQADVVVENVFRTQVQHQAYLEPYNCVVRIAEDGRAEFWGLNKIPFALRDQLSQALDLPPERILVHAVHMGGEFGAKADPGDAYPAYYLARATGRAVKFINTYQEELIAGTPRHAAVIRIRTGAKRDGTITAWNAQVLWNSGAYAGHKPALFNGNLGGSNNAAGWWAIPNVRIEALMVYTNIVPCAYMRSPGQPQTVFAAEAQMDLVARELGLDPLEIRLRNLPTDTFAREAVSRAAEAVGWTSPKPAHVGRGVAVGARGTGAGMATSDITLNPDGTITAITALPDQGTGGLTIVAQVVAEVWNVPLDRVQVVHGDTDMLPVDVGSGGSSITNSAGHAAMAASRKVQEQLAPLAAQLLGVPEAEWRDGAWRAVGRADGRAISVEELATEVVREGDERAHAQVSQAPERSPNQLFCGQAAEVEVDPETGQVRLRKLVTVQDVATIINEIGHQGQIDGSVVQGIGLALMEEVGLEEGRVTTQNLGEYKLPTIRDIPELITINVQADTGPGPFNAKGIGETPHVPTAAAIANAVADAIGAPIRELPVTADRVIAATEAGQNAG